MVSKVTADVTGSRIFEGTFSATDAVNPYISSAFR